MGVCKNCKHWGRDYKGVCDYPNVIQDDMDTQFEVDIRADDDQGLEFRLVTGPYFGCIKFKQR